MHPAFYQRKIRPYSPLNRKLFWRFLLLVFAVIVVNSIWKFGESQYGRFRSARQTTEAEAFIRDGRKPEAISKLSAALESNPRNINANRLFAGLLDEQGDARAMEFYRFVVLDSQVLPGELADINFSHGGSSEFFAEGGDMVLGGDRFLGTEEKVELAPHARKEDAEALARAAAKYGNPRVAREVALLVSEKWNAPEFPRLINGMIDDGRNAGAVQDATPEDQEKTLRAALKKNEDSQTLGALAGLLLSDTEMLDLNAKEVASLLRRLAKIDPGPQGLQALRTGLDSGILGEDDFKIWLALYRAHPAATTSSRIDAAKIEIQKNPERTSEIVQQLVDSLSNEPITGRVEAARWLLGQGNPRAAQSILPLDQAKEAREPLELWIESAAALGQWEQIESLLKKPLPSLPDSARLPELARAVKMRGRVNEATALHKETIRRFQSDPGALAEVLCHLLAAGEWDLFDQNLSLLVNDPRFESETLLKFVTVARTHRDSKRMVEFYEKMVRSPFLALNPFVLDRLQFNRLILGKPVAMEEIEYRFQQAGSDDSFRVTAALGFLLNDRKTKALNLLEESPNPIDCGKLPPQQAAVYAAVLEANGRRDEARAIASRIPRNNLTREEEAFLDQALAD
ncbi:MAG: hypothetical protein ACKOAS_03000 [Verrucomicrobiota bacterium]